MNKDNELVLARNNQGSTNMPSKAQLDVGFSNALKLVDDVILKNYIADLSELDLKVIPLDSSSLSNNIKKIRLFKITQMVYEQNETATYKFASVVNAVAATNSAIFTIIDSRDGITTDFYLGIRSLSDINSTNTSYQTLIKTMEGQFPGIKFDNLYNNQIEDLLKNIETNAISSVSCVANNKNEEFIHNDDYLQGLEKFALAMRGSKYTAIIIANPTPQSQLNSIRQGYETIYTQLSPYANSVVNYGTNSSTSQNKTETFGENESDAHGVNSSTTTTVGKSTSVSHTETKTETEGTSTSFSLSRTLTDALTLGASLKYGAVGASLAKTFSSAISGSISHSESDSTSTSTSKTTSKSETTSNSNTQGTSDTHTSGTSHSMANSLGLSLGESQNLQLTVQDKRIIDILSRIDKQIERVNEFESVGMWECAAYFMSADPSATEAAAATYKALMSGENTGLEVSAINTWLKPNVNKEQTKEKSQNELVTEYITNFIHPAFQYNILGRSIPVLLANLVSSNELAIHMGLPRKSVCGFPVIEHANFGHEVRNQRSEKFGSMINIGSIFNMGNVHENPVKLDVESLTMHSFIVGATGSGKSNTVYQIINELRSSNIDNFSFMVIEPAKGEYKKLFGHKKKVKVFGTNPNYTELLRINPFKFPKEIHILEHIDRLIEIFNVCWPMYAAMPAVLKDAIIEAYETCGWDTLSSKNFISDNLFPSFQDLQEQLITVIDNSSYSDEVKSNYKGSLLTRVKSLTNGLNGMIFSSNEIDNKILFDSNVIIDLSRVGSQETKSLLMGILVMKLTEHRMSNSTGSNSKLRHITVLEEAHNILRNTSTITSSVEGGNVASKSVEMLSNAIAEMRTYGEGFIIADQSPSAVDISAIRNTNTKIIMRLPDESDRRTAGKAAALKDDQLEEIAKLPNGVAVVYQNDWLEPVLCQVEKFDGEEKEFQYSPQNEQETEKSNNSLLINFVLNNRLQESEPIDLTTIEQAIERSEYAGSTKVKLHSLVKEYKKNQKLSIWDQDKSLEQAQFVLTILHLERAILTARKVSNNLRELNILLNTYIARKFDRVNDDLIVNIKYCLVKAYSSLGEKEHKFCSELWNFLKKGN